MRKSYREHDITQVGEHRVFYSDHALRRALEMKIDAPELREAIDMPVDVAESRKYEGSWNYHGERICLGVVIHEDGTLIVTTCVWRSHRLWQKHQDTIGEDRTLHSPRSFPGPRYRDV